VVGFLGLAGNVARGVVFGGAGVFLVVAAASSGPDQAQGLDGLLADRRVCVGYRLRWLRRASGCRCESLLQVSEVRDYADNPGDLQDPQDIATGAYQP